MTVQLEEQPFLRPQLRVAEVLPAPPGLSRGDPPAWHGRALGFFDRAGDRYQQAFAGSEVVKQHAVAGTDGARQLAQAQVGDPALHRLIHRGGQQPLPGLRCGHAEVYHLVHVPLGTSGG